MQHRSEAGTYWTKPKRSTTLYRSKFVSSHGSTVASFPYNPEEKTNTVTLQLGKLSWDLKLIVADVALKKAKFTQNI